MNIKTLTMVFGGLFVVLGGVAFAISQAPTSLIPAVLGALMALCAQIAKNKENLSKHLMHAAVLLGLIGFVASVAAVPKFIELLSGTDVERPVAVVTRTVMALLSAIYLGFAIKSFVDARRNRA
jgi:apolipoprotein N-acyltransferase